MLSTVVSEKGQVVIPVAVRRQAGLSGGDRLTVTYEAGTREIRLRRPETIDEMADRFTAWLKPGIPPLEDVSGFYETREARL